ncbi:hypothetical protein F4778DRAFT_4419 [Xylariomycetidae sp. FL2044]|nr:hypothetical protein F4778DRAFT_4419 [Xylariomycetidae sp. FL2044]
MAAATSHSGVSFMFVNDGKGITPEDRRRIRSLVMKGRNKGKQRPLGSGYKRELPEDVRDDDCLPPRDSDALNFSKGYDRTPSCPTTSSDLTPVGKSSGVTCAAIPIPPSVGSAASMLCLADPVKPATVEIVIRLSMVAKQLLFPLERCMHFEGRAEHWIAPLATDSLFLHSNIFFSLFYFDMLHVGRPCPPRQRTLYHHNKALTLLRERLLSDDDSLRLSNNTIAVVFGLAAQAFVNGDSRSAIHHMEGISRIVSLRGGLSALAGNEKLATEILRCDLALVLSSGSSPMFSNGNPSSMPLPPYPDLTVFFHGKSATTKGHRCATSTTRVNNYAIDPNLALSWKTLADFCTLINIAAATNQRITVGTYRSSMVSTMYGLIHMHFESSSEDEVVRLGLLCFSCSVFLQWHNLGRSYDHLASLYRRYLPTLTDTCSEFPPQLSLWLIMAGAVSVFGPSDDVWLIPYLRRAMSRCDVNSWSDMHQLLMSIMWIDLVHGKPGRRIYQSAMSNQP